MTMDQADSKIGSISLHAYWNDACSFHFNIGSQWMLEKINALNSKYYTVNVLLLKQLKSFS